MTDEMFALSLGWDYEIMVTVPMFCKEYVLCFCPDLKMKWAKDPDFGTPVFQPSQDGDIYIAVETYLYLINTEDISTVVQTLKEPHPHYRSVWVGARRLI